MKKIALLIVAIATLLGGCSDSWKVQSPNGKISLDIDQDPYGHLLYSVSLDNKIIIQSSRLALALKSKSQDFTGKLINTGMKQTMIDETYKMKSGKKSECRNHANELTLSFKNTAKGKMDVIFRCYDDGIAFRYQLYNTSKDTVKEEISSFVLDSKTIAWLADYRSDYEMFYNERKLDTLKIPSGLCPALFKTPSEHWILASDAAVYGNYAASRLFHQGNGEMRFVIPNDIQPGSVWYPGTWEELTMKEDTLIEAQPNLITPWRALIISDNLGKIVESTLIENLNPACEITDTSWIKPGIACFPWWSDNIANDRPDRLRKFIDVASDMHWQYIEFDIGLLGNNGGYAINKWRTVKYIPEIIKYAKSKGIEVYGWDERKNLDTPEKRADIFGKYSEWGVAGIKIDFLNSDKQEAMAFREDALRDAAKYKLLVSFHGDITPKGQRRRFPNFVTQEGVRGEEYYKFAPDKELPTPTHNCTLPFTRNVVGPMDYTPVGFSTPEGYSKPRRKTTYCHELALPVIYESGWTCMADSPEEFEKCPAKPYLQKLTSTWDDTHFITGYPGQYVVMARRKGNDWYVAGINAGEARWIKFPLFDFLKKGIYKVACYRDPAPSDGSFTGPKEGKADVKVDSITITTDYPQYFPISANGGFVFIIPDSKK